MSWEAWGSGPEPFDVDVLVRHGWSINEDCTMARRFDEEWIPIQEAIEWYENWISDIG